MLTQIHIGQNYMSKFITTERLGP